MVPLTVSFSEPLVVLFYPAWFIWCSWVSQWPLLMLPRGWKGFPWAWPLCVSCWGGKCPTCCCCLLWQDPSCLLHLLTPCLPVGKGGASPACLLLVGLPINPPCQWCWDHLMLAEGLPFHPGLPTWAAFCWAAFCC